MRKLLYILLFLSFSGCSKPLILNQVKLNADKYFTYGVNNQRTFYIDETFPDSLEVVWSNDLYGSQWSTSLSIMDDLLITSDLAGRIFAFDLKSGKNRGATKYDGGIFTQPAIYKNKLLFVVNEEKETYSKLVYYDFINNKTILENNLEGNVRNELLLVDNNLFVLTDNGVLHKYNPVGGEIYQTPTEVLTNTTPAFLNGDIIFANLDGEVIAINEESGEISFRKKITSSIAGDLSINKENAFFGDNGGNIFCFNLNTMEILWKRNLGAKILAAPSIDENSLYVGTLAGEVFALSKITGEIRWKMSTGGLINNAILVGNNNIIVPDLNRKLHIVDKHTGRLISKNEFPGRLRTSPVYFDGMFYTGYDKGIVSALRGKE